MILKIKDWVKKKVQFTYNSHTKTAIRLSDGKEFRWEEEVSSPIGLGKIYAFKDDNIHVYIIPQGREGSIASIEIEYLCIAQEYIKLYKEMEGM